MKGSILYLQQANKGSPLFIDTKVNCPRAGHDLVTRSKLFEKLDKGLSSKLILVIAAAGYGKSALLANWIGTRKKPAAWLNLEPEDNDVVRFWGYFFHALKSIQLQPGRKAAEYLQSSGPFHIERILNIFINELNRDHNNSIIILDDFHVIEDQKIISSITYLIDHLPDNFHICLAGRTFPALLLAELRAKGQMVEILTDDLRFTPGETRIFFKKRLKYNLPQQEIRIATQRIEGWVAGLQMVSLLPESLSDKKRLLTNITGDQRNIMDYFSEVIVNQKSSEVQSFLLRTSVLQRMNGSICNVLTGRNDGNEMLEQFDQLNMFTFPLDNRRYWYRYHHLFAEALRTIAEKKELDCLKKLHQKAAGWFRENGYCSEAIQHALLAQEYNMAAELIEEEAPRLFKTGEIVKLSNWISSLPKAIYYRRPKIWLYYTWGLNLSGDLGKAYSSCIEMIEFTKDINKISQMEDKSSLSFVKSEVDIIKSSLDFYQGKFNALEDYKKAIQNIKKGSLPAEGLVRFNTGSASLLQCYVGRYGNIRIADHFFSSTEPAIEKIRKDFPSFALGYALVGEIRYEQNDIVASEKYVKNALQIGKKEIDPGVLVPAYIVLTNIEMARGRFIAADDLWRTLERRLETLDLYQWTSIYYAHKARISIKKGMQEEVRSWVESSELSIDDEVTVLQCYQFTTLVRALLYQSNPRDAFSLSEKILTIVEEEGGVGQRIEILLLQAFCYQALNLIDRALTVLEQAALMGYQDGYCRIFIDEGEKLLNLFQLLIAQFQYGKDSRPKELLQYIDNICKSSIADTKATELKLIHEMAAALTRREWEVLRLVSEGRTNHEIAKTLFISIPTVNTHLRNIYRKLNVNSRTKAIALVKDIEYLG